MAATRKPLLAGNWKMHCLGAEARALAEGICKECAGLSDREVLVAPPYTALATVAAVIRGSHVLLAAQNVHWEEQGAFTGEVSAPMLRDIGCTHVIIGHSERRQWFGETDDGVARKVRAAQAAGLVPILCVGETLAEREAGTTLDVVGRQVRRGLPQPEAAAIRTLVIAYEPVWAIGTGKVATPEQAQEAHAFIRKTLAGMVGEQAANAVRILYGGSVKPDNIDELMAQPDIDGALVGGASLKVDSFVRIVKYRRNGGPWPGA